MNLRIYDGRSQFYQYDLNQKLIVEDVGDVTCLHFANSANDYAIVKHIYTNSEGIKVCDVPNIMLTYKNKLIVYGCIVESDTKCTLEEFAFVINERPKPSDYESAVEEEVYKWVELDERISQLEEDIANNGKGLTEEQINALDGMFKVCAYIKEDVSTEYNAFKTAFGLESGGEVEPDEPITPTLTSIEATYSGGDVEVETELTDLASNIVVNANYSDGTTQTVTGYELSGSINEGTNTITVTYQGKSTTFTVTGYVEVDDNVVNVTWYDGNINNSGIVDGGSHSNIFDVRDVTTIVVTTTYIGWTSVRLRKFNSLEDEIGVGLGFIAGDVTYIDNDASTDNRGDTIKFNVSGVNYVCISIGNYSTAISTEHLTVRKE